MARHHPLLRIEITTVVVERTRGFPSVRPRELWAYRELLYFLTWRDIKVRYKQTLLGLSWAVLQPVRSLHAEDDALAATSRGDYAAAARHARDAASIDPLSLEPLWLMSFVADARGDKATAERMLERAARRQPANAEAWRRLGRYRLSELNDPRGAVDAFRIAYYFDPDALQRKDRGGIAE